MQVVVAIEPRIYREAIGESIRALRPHVEVYVLDPDTLGAGLRRLEPELVFANQPNTFAPDGRSAWVEFLPYEHPPAQVCLAGRRRELEEVELEDLLLIVDEAEELAQRGGELGDC